MKQRVSALSRMPGVALTLAAAAIALPILVTGPITYHLDTAKACAYVALVLVFVLWSGLSVRRLPRPHPVLIVYFAYIVATLISRLWSRPSYFSLDHLALHIASWILVYCSLSYDWRRLEVLSIVDGFLWTVSLAAAYGIAESVGLVAPFGRTDPLERHIVATAGNSSYLAGLLAVTLPLTVSRLVSVFRSFQRLKSPRAHLSAWAIAFVLQLSALALTLNRTGWLVAVVATGFCLAMLPWAGVPVRRRLTIPASLMVLVVMVALVAYAVSAPVRQRVERTVTDDWQGAVSALGVRAQIWQSALSILGRGAVPQSLFGNGPGAFYRLMFSHYPNDYRLSTLERGARSAHNTVLDHLVEGGVVQLALWVIMLVWTFNSCRRVVADATASREIRSLAAGVIAGLAALLMHSLLHITSRTTIGHASFTLLLLVAVILDMYRPDTPCLARLQAPHPRTWPGSQLETRLAAVVVACAAFIIVIRPFTAEMILLRALRNPDQPGSVTIADQELLSSAVRNQPENVHVLYEQLLRQKDAPDDDGLKTAARIAQLIPAYRDTDRIAGILRAQRGEFELAFERLDAHLRRDIVEPGVYMHAVSVLCMLSRVAEAADLYGNFFQWQHRYFTRNPQYHVGLLLEPTSGQHGAADPAQLFPADRLSAVVETLAANQEFGYDFVHANLMLNTAVLFEMAAYGDVALDYYLQVYLARRLDRQWQLHAYEMARHFVDLAESSRTEAEKAGRSQAARALLSRQIQLVDYLILLRPAEETIAERGMLFALYAQKYR